MFFLSGKGCSEFPKRMLISIGILKRAGQAEKALYLLNTISAITDRGNNAEVRRKKDGSLTVYEVKKNIVTV